MADKPVTREEKYLAYLTGDYKGELTKPITRKEKYLYELCLKGMGGEISPEEIKNAVNEYLEKNPVKPGATTEQAQQIEQNRTDIASLKEETGSLKGDLANSKKSIAELNDKKITKFYASNLGETNLSDSDKGKIQDMMLYGKSIQDGTPTPDNPIEIQSVVNPKLSVCGVNVFDYEKYITSSSYEENGYTVRNYQLEPNTKYYFKNIVRRANSTAGIWLLQPNDSTINGENFIGLTTNYQLIESFTTKQDGIIKIGCMNVVDKNYLKDNLIISTNEIVTSVFVPFKGYQTATLPYTLNAIPVSSGGNVTIDGQQYIADYVDIERKKIHRLVDSSKLDPTFSIIDNRNWLLSADEVIDITDEEVQAFKELATYYHTTNVTVTSDQIDGFTTFNYPVSLKNGWEYVKQQIGDTREYIYDMELQSAEAYVNSEYAVTLTELGV